MPPTPPPPCIIIPSGVGPASSYEGNPWGCQCLIYAGGSGVYGELFNNGPFAQVQHMKHVM